MGAAPSRAFWQVVFPLALFIPANKVHLSVHWPYLITLLPLAAVMSAAFGLTIGTRVEPRQVPLIFSLLVIPMTFLGAVYYPWKSLSAIPWLKWAVLINPLVYMSEGMRMALTKGVLPRARRVHRGLLEARNRRLQEARIDVAATSTASGPSRALRGRQRARHGAGRSTRLLDRAPDARTTRGRRRGSEER